MSFILKCFGCCSDSKYTNFSDQREQLDGERQTLLGSKDDRNNVTSILLKRSSSPSLEMEDSASIVHEDSHSYASPTVLESNLQTQGRSIASSAPQSSSSTSLTMTWKNRGEYHLDRKELDLAVDAYTKALLEAEERKDLPLVAESLKNIGRVFLEKGQWAFAVKILNGALALLRQDSTFNEKAQKVLFSYLAEAERCFLEKECHVKVTTRPEIYTACRKQLQMMRDSIRTRLQSHDSSNEDPIGFSKNILSDFSTFIAHFLQEIIKSGYLILGNPPCEYALIGLGSLGRKEMSPYSDLEFAILIEESSSNNLDYFRKLVKWLEIQVINLGETEIKILKGGLNSPIRKGFSFDDGGNTPLGKQSQVELIKDPQEMAQFQSERCYDEDLILSNVLRTVELLTGEQSLYKSYLKSMQGILSKKATLFSLSIAKQRALNLIRGHLVEFEPEVGRRKEEIPFFNIKAELYRLPSFLIAGLADYFGIEVQNTWDKLDALLEKNILSSKGVQNLREALAKIMRLRIRCHLHYDRECDEVYHPAMQRTGISKEKIQQAFILTDEMIEEIISIYRVIFPLHRLFKEASRTGNFESLHQEAFYDDSLLVQGQTYDRLSQFQEAKKCFQQAIALNPDDAEVQLQLANLLNDLAEHDEAKKYVEKALSNNGTSDDIISRALNCQGRISAVLGDSKSAIQQYTRALEINKKLFGNESPDVAIDFVCLGTAWQDLGDASKAIEYYIEGQKIIGKVYGNEGPMMGTLLNNLGIAWKDLGDAEKAIECLEEALRICKNVYGDEHPRVAATLSNLGMAWKALDDGEKAIEHLEEALSIDKCIFGDEHPSIAINLSNLGSVLQSLGNAEEAIEYYNEALRIDKKVYGDDHPEVAIDLNNLGAAWEDLGDAEKATLCLEEALKINRKIYGKEHPKVATILSHLGSALQTLGDAEKAIEYLEEALKIFKKVYGDEHPSVATLYGKIGLAWQDLKNPNKHLEYAEEALRINKKIYGDEHSAVAANIHHIGVAWQTMGEKEKAIKCYEEALRINKCLYGDEHPNVAACLQNIGSACKALGDDKKAINYYEKALEIFEKFYRNEHPTVAIIFNNLAIAWQKLGNPKKAKEYFKKALKIFTALYGVHHPKTQAVLMSMQMSKFLADVKGFDILNSAVT